MTSKIMRTAAPLTEGLKKTLASLKLLIQAPHPIVAIETRDEPRAVRLVSAAAADLGLPLFEWSVTQGMKRLRPAEDVVLLPPGPAADMLAHLGKSAAKALYLLHDLAPHCPDPVVQRHLWEIYHRGEAQLGTLILLDSMPLPEPVRRMAMPLHLGWPEPAELDQAVRQAFNRAWAAGGRKATATLSAAQMEQLVECLRGLTCAEAGRIVAAAVLDDNCLGGDDLPRIVDAKRDLLGNLGCLEPIAVDLAPQDVGGLNGLKRWLERRRSGLTPKARQFGLEPPRGVLLLGVQGCGKSLCAKVVASGWGVPLLRLDPSSLYQRYVGDSEGRLRDALRQAEAMAPVVLWIDEIEKAFASASANSADGGLSQRMFATLLSWMQDHRHPIFLVATANDIAALPPELMRKGRFDEVFFVDLPSAEERGQIFAVHLRRRRRDPALFDLGQLAQAAEGFSGAEIEQAVMAALYSAFAAGTELSTALLLAEIEATRPLAVLMQERIADLRAWAKQRCVPAH